MTNALLDPLVQAALANVATAYEVLECSPDLADTAAFCEAYGYDIGDCANTIVVAAKTEPIQYVACVVLGSTKLDVNKAVCKKLGVKKASFANGDQTVALTNMMIGGVTAVGLPNDLLLWVDSRVMDRESVILGGGNRSSKLLCSPKLLLGLPNAEVVEGLAQPKSQD